MRFAYPLADGGWRPPANALLPTLADLPIQPSAVHEVYGSACKEDP
jgi:hypothetical protein